MIISSSSSSTTTIIITITITITITSMISNSNSNSALDLKCTKVHDQNALCIWAWDASRSRPGRAASEPSGTPGAIC